MTTLYEQLKLTYSATTPCGAVSALIPFLPRNAHASVIEHCFRNETCNPPDRYESASMNSTFRNYFLHVKLLYYQILKSRRMCI